MIPVSILPVKNLTWLDKVVYGALRYRASDSDTCEVKLSKLAEDLGVCCASVQRSIKALIGEKLIERERSRYGSKFVFVWAAVLRGSLKKTIEPERPTKPDSTQTRLDFYAHSEPIQGGLPCGSRVDFRADPEWTSKSTPSLTPEGISEGKTHIPDACASLLPEHMSPDAFEAVTEEIWKTHPPTRRGTLQLGRQYASAALDGAVNRDRLLQLARENHERWLAVYNAEGWAHSLRVWWSTGEWRNDPGVAQRKADTNGNQRRSEVLAGLELFDEMRRRS
jgi:hypothetical protein